ncbi:MAG: methylenetetrahydrofolate--tRNA-(uracil(54)-C(5))-methyltransferase (FADH(2)-oxidizing) TrmFO [Saccharofermentanales bacterium]
MKITIIGAGLAGCEAAYQVTRFGIPVKLIDMKPGRLSPAHHDPKFAELVCSNSLKSNRIQTACGLLKEELRHMDSLLMNCATKSQVPAGSALAVDRDKFSDMVTDAIKQNALIEIVEQSVSEIPDDECVIVATGPLTQAELMENIKIRLGVDELYFFDAASPIVSADSINMDIAFRQSRYNIGGDDYINCPMNQSEYEIFTENLIKAETAPVHDFEKSDVFEACMPIEIMALRGADTIRYGPMKPVGLSDPKTDERPYACVQLRQDDSAANLFNMVGFQTRLKFKEQERVFRMIPGLENAEFMRYGVMHKNTYIKSPGFLDSSYQSIQYPNLFFAGQLTGVEGYVESISSGMIAGINAALYACGIKEKFVLPTSTMTGALSAYISNRSIKNFQPMNANFGLIDPLDHKVRKKEDRYNEIAAKSLKVIDEYAAFKNFTLNSRFI